MQVDVRSDPTNSLLRITLADEVVTGFRMHLGGAQALYGVIPDLGCFGKAMGNGYPIAAVVGRRDVMKVMDDIFFSFTFGGDVLGGGEDHDVEVLTNQRVGGVAAALFEAGLGFGQHLARTDG